MHNALQLFAKSSSRISSIISSFLKQTHFARITCFLLTVKSLMDYWRGVLRVPVGPSSTSYCGVAVPPANAIFFSGDRVEGTRNPVIERLSDPQNIAEILVSKFGSTVNAWVIEAPVFNGPFAVYRDFIPSVNRWGEPKFYSAAEFPASTSTISLLSNCLKEVKNVISRKEKEPLSTSVSSSFCEPKTLILGFSKGGTVLNQLVTELSLSEVKSNITEHSMSKEFSEQVQIIPCSKESLLKSITEIHYVDVGLNSAGAYITDHNVIESISKIAQATGIRFVFHGTPRQWCDRHRVWIFNEKNKLVNLLESAAQGSGGKLKVCEKFYFADRSPDMQMHFEVIETVDVSLSVIGHGLRLLTTVTIQLDDKICGDIYGS